eukprot:5136482-Prymnesium_polylepis.1
MCPKVDHGDSDHHGGAPRGMVPEPWDEDLITNVECDRKRLWVLAQRLVLPPPVATADVAALTALHEVVRLGLGLGASNSSAHGSTCKASGCISGSKLARIGRQQQHGFGAGDLRHDTIRCAVEMHVAV